MILTPLGGLRCVILSDNSSVSSLTRSVRSAFGKNTRSPSLDGTYFYCYPTPSVPGGLGGLSDKPLDGPREVGVPSRLPHMDDQLPPEPPAPIEIDGEAPGDTTPPPAAPSRPVATKRSQRGEGAISPSSFYVAPPSSKESERISVRVDAATQATAMRLIETRMFGWESFSDFTRWALWRGVMEAAKALRDDELSNELRVMAALQRRAQIQKRESDFASSLAQIRVTIQTLLNSSADADALILFREVMADAEAMTISRFKIQFMTLLRESFPQLAKEYDEPS